MLTLKALLSAANMRKPSLSAFEPWKRMELASLKPAYLDSLMYQDYNYSSVKTPSGLTARTLDDASDFLTINL